MNESYETAEFRLQTRLWLEANCPAEMRQPMNSEEGYCWGGRHWRFASEAQAKWLAVMAERGWTTPTWPREYGGGDLSIVKAAVLSQELKALGCRSPLSSFGIWMLGPALLKFGTEEQKHEHLPKIARGEIRWCQGYSEPNAGSDLAALATRAEDRGDHFIVNGQKIWTSHADQADWIFCLVRTDTTKKQGGISFVLFDMATPGIRTKPIQLISGKSPFCETFFDNVRVEKSNLVGELNRGWDVAKYLLTHEREMIGTGGDDHSVRSLSSIAIESIGYDAEGRLADLNLRGQIADFELDDAAFLLAAARVGELTQLQQANPAMSSMLKYGGAVLQQRRWELTMAIGGSYALEWQGERSECGATARTWLRSKGNSIEGGTNEVQLNVIAKRILELPGA